MASPLLQIRGGRVPILKPSAVATNTAALDPVPVSCQACEQLGSQSHSREFQLQVVSSTTEREGHLTLGVGSWKGRETHREETVFPGEVASVSP